MIKQARYRGRDALSALHRKEWAYATRLSQESLELYLKGLLTTLEIDFPKRHDFSAFLLEIKDVLPKNVLLKINEIAGAVDILSQLRSPSFYGDEAKRIEPDDLIDQKTAEEAVKMLQLVAETVEADIEAGRI